jgi:putative membrane protein
MNYYLLFKSLHLISVISWMAGLLYLPRLFVYHAETSRDNKIKKTFKTMERRLYFYIMNPAMILSWFFGILLILTTYHFFLFYCLKSLRQNNSKYSPRFYRIINEVPTLLLISIIFVVVYKPL